jgi:hypothetical protein
MNSRRFEWIACLDPMDAIGLRIRHDLDLSGLQPPSQCLHARNKLRAGESFIERTTDYVDAAERLRFAQRSR